MVFETEKQPQTKSTQQMLPRKMLPRSHPDGIHIGFDDHRLVNNAGLILPGTLAQHLGLPQLVQQRLDLGNARVGRTPATRL